MCQLCFYPIIRNMTVNYGLISASETLSSVCGLRLLHRRQKRIIGGKNSLR
jgi:hypothetical protein